MTTREKYQQLQGKIQELKKQTQEIGNEFFMEESKNLFTKYPLLEEFSWTQYTPYFNDGDECVFGVNTEPHFTYAGEEYKYCYEESEPIQTISNEIEEILAIVDKDDFKAIFGDHCKVVIKNTGDIEIEEYEHD